MLGGIYIPEATLVEDNPMFLKKNITIVAFTILVVVTLIAVLFAITERKDSKEQNTTATIVDEKPPIISPTPDAYFSPDPEERFFVCEDINDKMEGCLDAECVDDSSCSCNSKPYHRVKATKEITGYCDTYAVCASAETNAPPPRADYVEPFFLCYTLRGESTQEGCVRPRV